MARAVANALSWAKNKYITGIKSSANETIALKTNLVVGAFAWKKKENVIMTNITLNFIKKESQNALLN